MVTENETIAAPSVLTLGEAQARLREAVAEQAISVKTDTEVVELSDALGRVASSDIESSLATPPSDNSAMDGFAVRSSDINTLQVSLPISQRIPAGVNPAPLKPGTAARIFTGGVMPLNADAVVIQENCEYDKTRVTIKQASTTAGDNVRPAGQDITLGAKVIRRGQTLNAIDLSLLSSIGLAQVEVIRPLSVAIFSTGDELIEPGQALKPGQIYNSNRTLLMALCKRLGYATIDCGIVEDTLLATKVALASAAQKADIIISSGGVSVGEEDHVKPAVEELGSLDMWRVQMKPGKPVAFGHINGKAFLGLPGNPVSSFVVFQLLGVPLLQSVQGQTPSYPTAYPVRSGFSKKTSSREEYVRVRLERDESGQLVAQRFANLSSGVLSSLSWADGLVRQGIDQAIVSDQLVEFFPLNEAML